MRSLSMRFACVILSVGCMFAMSASAVVWNVFPEDVRTVGVVSVSDIVGAANLTRATNELTNAGYAVKVMPNVSGPKQASAAERAKYFEEAWLDPSIDLLMFSTGGQGAIDVIDVIDWEKLKARDMRVIGFSDLTLVLNTMLKKGVGHPLTGPMISTLGSLTTSDEARLRMRATLDGTPKETQLKAVRKASGVIVGKPMGGLLDRVWKLAERGLLPSAEGRFVFLENTPKYAAGTWQMLDRLIELGAFDKAVAVVFCDFNRDDPAEDVARVFSDFAKKVECPVYSGYPYGHVANSYLLDFKMQMAITTEHKLVKASGELDLGLGPSSTIQVTGAQVLGKEVNALTVSFAASDEPRSLWMVYGGVDRGIDPMNWQNRKVVAQIAPGVTSVTCSVPQGWPKGAAVTKFLMTSAGCRLLSIDGTGSHAIDTGIYPCGTSTAVRVDVKLNKKRLQGRFFGVSYDASGKTPTTECYCFYVNGSSYYAWACNDGYGSWKSTGIDVDLARKILTLDPYADIVKVEAVEGGGTELLFSKAVSASVAEDKRRLRAKWTLGLFGTHGGTGWTVDHLSGAATLYSCQISESGVLVRDFVPWLNEEGKAGLRDLKGGGFYANDYDPMLEFTPGERTGLYEVSDQLLLSADDIEKLCAGQGDLVGVDYVADFVTTHGTEWYDMGLYLTNGVRIELDFVPLAIGRLFGARFEASSRNIAANIDGYSSPKFYIDNLTGGATSPYRLTPSCSFNVRYKLVLSRDETVLTGNGVEVARATEHCRTDFCTPKNSYLFHLNGYDGSKGNLRFYSCRILMGGVALRDYVPVSKDGVGYVYDRVTKTILSNKGSGDLEASGYRMSATVSEEASGAAKGVVLDLAETAVRQNVYVVSGVEDAGESTNGWAYVDLVETVDPGPGFAGELPLPRSVGRDATCFRIITIPQAGAGRDQPLGVTQLFEVLSAFDYVQEKPKFVNFTIPAQDRDRVVIRATGDVDCGTDLANWPQFEVVANVPAGTAVLRDVAIGNAAAGRFFLAAEQDGGYVGEACTAYGELLRAGLVLIVR